MLGRYPKAIVVAAVCAASATYAEAQVGIVGQNWLPTTAEGANWIPRDSRLSEMHDKGGIALSGLSRCGDGLAYGYAGACIGIASFIVGNKPNASQWATYFECQLELEPDASCYVSEMDAKNKGANYVPYPSALSYGAYDLWLAAGGDARYGGASTNPSAAAVAIVKNTNTWNVGIVVGSEALTGSTGKGGKENATAIALGSGQYLKWYLSGNYLAGKIGSRAQVPSDAANLTLIDNGLEISDNAGNPVMTVSTDHSALTLRGEIRIVGVAPVTTTGCNITSESTDVGGTIKIKSGSDECRLSFSTAKSNTPTCVISREEGGTPPYSVSKSALSIKKLPNSEAATIDYICIGHSG